MKKNSLILNTVFVLFISNCIFGFCEETKRISDVESVRITVKEGKVFDEKTGRTLVAGDRLVLHANGESEWTNSQTAPNPVQPGPANGNLPVPNIPLQEDSNATPQITKREISIQGEVVDGKGQPVWDAQVMINGSTEHVLMTGNQFSMESLSPGEYQIKASHPTLLGVTKNVQAGETITLQLREKAQVVVAVKTKRGEPVPGAWIDFLSAKDQRFIKAIREKSDAEGRVVFDQVLPGNYTLGVEHAWYISSSRTAIEVDEAMEVVELVLPDNSLSVSGKVTDAKTGEVLPNIPIVCGLDKGQSVYGAKGYPLEATRVVTTDAEGNYSVDNLWSGRYILYVDDMEGYLSGNQLAMESRGGVDQTRVVLTDAEADNVNFQLKHSWMVSGTVYDWQNIPLPNVPVSVLVWHEHRGREDDRSTVQTDEQGYYEIVGKTEVIPGCKIQTKSAHNLYWGGYSEDFIIEPGQRMDGIDIHFKGTAIIRGTVRNEQGEPLHNALVQFWSDWKESYPGAETEDIEGYAVRTDQNGCYECIIRQPGKYTALSDAVGYRSTVDDQALQQLNIEISDEPIYVDFTLLPGEDKTVEGIVVNEEGEPVEGITVRLMPCTIAKYKDYYAYSSNNYQTSLLHTTDSSGTFCFDVDFFDPNIFTNSPLALEQILSGQAKPLQISIDDNDAYQVTVHPITKSSHRMIQYPGEKDLRIEVERKEQASGAGFATLAGRVVDSFGIPVTQFEMVVIPGWPPQRFEDGTPYHQWSPVYSSDGRFQIDGLPVKQGAFYIVVRTDEYGMSTSTPLSPEANQVLDNIEIVVGSGVTITGTVLDAITGKPIPDIKVLAMLPPSPERQHLMMTDRIILRRTGLSGRIVLQEQSVLNEYIPRAVTDAKGRFVIKNAPVPATFLHVQPSREYNQFVRALRPLEHGQTVELGEIKISRR
ncbi:MAG: carboxypeptidase regulatory-like domain-containing protein [Candidatus Omnitrophota bacterium]|jgi:protocatechuate 3,4-dioxygenase beta subunit|nr:MAG: carboxypeptidase regulatory-like domain-containing protein [Candidatus Omnitrophota bacterium]